jgi:hypothetical protein
MSDEKNFVDGLIIKLPDDNAPDFVKLKLSLKLDELGAWISTQKKSEESLEWINIEIKEGRSGKWYAERNMWKPPEEPKPAASAPSQDVPW